MSTQEQAARPPIALGTAVGHVNPELADWEGTVTANRQGNWNRRRWEDLPEVWVKWHAGTCGDGEPLADTKPGWFPADALTVAGECPDCARPAHYIPAGNNWDRSEGWHHDYRHDLMTCWAGKAAFEARNAELAATARANLDRTPAASFLRTAGGQFGA